MDFEIIDWKKHKKHIIVGIILLILVLFGGIYLVHASSVPKEENGIPIVKQESKVDQESVSIDEKFLVDVKGAVANPGVYQLSKGCSVQDAIHMAGGLLDNSNTSTINLSKRIFDEMVIIVYTNEQIDEYKKDPEIITEFIYVEIPCECPDNMNDACIKEKNEISADSNLISINTATKEQLMTLSGIGESKAKAIISYRDKNGNFKTIEDIMNVSGIGESAFEKIKNQITI